MFIVRGAREVTSAAGRFTARRGLGERVALHTRLSQPQVEHGLVLRQFFVTRVGTIKPQRMAVYRTMIAGGSTDKVYPR